MSGLMTSFWQASEILEELGQLIIPCTTLWEHVEKKGEKFVQSQHKKEAQVSLERTRWYHQRYKPRLYRSVSIDGGQVHIRDEGWKEMKVGMVSGIEHQWDHEEQPLRLVNMAYTAVLGNVEEFKPALWALALEHDIPYAGCTAVTADGASWIWRLTQDLFPMTLQIVDWYHAREHLAKAASARFPEDEQEAQQWFQQMSKHLFKGTIWYIIADLHHHDLKKIAAYFVKHQRRMLYAAFRADGYPIGSGGVESGIKQFKQRLTGPGMRWSRKGAERMLIIRAAVMSHTLDDLWEQAA